MVDSYCKDRWINKVKIMITACKIMYDSCRKNSQRDLKDLHTLRETANILISQNQSLLNSKDSAKTKHRNFKKSFFTLVIDCGMIYP